MLKSLGKYHMLIIIQGDHWMPLTRQPSILGEFQGDKRPCVTIMGTTTELSYLG